MKHIAYNLNTGEIIITTNSFLSLLCQTRKVSRFDKKNYNVKAHWIYAHGTKADDKIRRKAELAETRQKIREFTAKIHELQNKQKGGE